MSLATEADYVEWEAERDANRRVDELERRLSKIETVTRRMDRLEERVKMIEAKMGMNEKTFVSMDTRLDNIETTQQGRIE